METSFSMFVHVNDLIIILMQCCSFFKIQMYFDLAFEPHVLQNCYLNYRRIYMCEYILTFPIPHAYFKEKTANVCIISTLVS